MPFEYTAPNPYPHRSDAHFFPFMSQAVGGFVLPSQTRVLTTDEQVTPEMLQEIKQTHHVDIQTGTVTTHDGAVLETFMIQPQQDERAIKDASYIVKFIGNWGQCQEKRRMWSNSRDADVLQARVVAYNYRGVHESRKKPVYYQDLVIDGVAQVQRLLDAGVPSHHILLDGTSLGGSVATMVAHHFHQLGLPVYLWNDRSFSSLSNAAAAYKIEPLLKIYIGAASEVSAKFLSRCLLETCQWDVPVSKYYLEIPVEYRRYMYIEDPLTSKEPNNIGDSTIESYAALNAEVGPVEEANNIRTGYALYAFQHQEGFTGHTQNRSDLRVCENLEKTAQDVYDEFYHSVFEPNVSQNMSFDRK